MNKIYFTLVNLFVFTLASAQNVNSGAENIDLAPISTPTSMLAEPPTGDDFFADAERSERSGNLNEALVLFGKAAFEYNVNKKFVKYGSALLRMSNVHLLLKHFTEAEQVALNVALKNYSRIGSKVGQMVTYNMLAKIYFEANKLPQSLWFYSQQGMSAQRLNNKAAYIDSVLGIALIKIKKQEYNLATKDVNRAELLAKNSNITHFAQQIKQSRNIIAAKKSGKK